MNKGAAPVAQGLSRQRSEAKLFQYSRQILKISTSSTSDIRIRQCNAFRRVSFISPEKTNKEKISLKYTNQIFCDQSISCAYRAICSLNAHMTVYFNYFQVPILRTSFINVTTQISHSKLLFSQSTKNSSDILRFPPNKLQNRSQEYVILQKPQSNH